MDRPSAHEALRFGTGRHTVYDAAAAFADDLSALHVILMFRDAADDCWWIVVQDEGLLLHKISHAVPVEVTSSFVEGVIARHREAVRQVLARELIAHRRDAACLEASSSRTGGAPRFRRMAAAIERVMRRFGLAGDDDPEAHHE